MSCCVAPGGRGRGSCVTPPTKVFMLYGKGDLHDAGCPPVDAVWSKPRLLVGPCRVLRMESAGIHQCFLFLLLVVPRVPSSQPGKALQNNFYLFQIFLLNISVVIPANI